MCRLGNQDLYTVWCGCVCGCRVLVSRFGVGQCDSLLLQPMWLTVCGRGGNCWSMPVVTRAFRGADVEQTEACRQHRQPRTDDSSLTPLSLLFVYFQSIAKRSQSTDRQVTVTRWLGRLKGFHLFRLQDKQLSKILVSSPCKQPAETVGWKRLFTHLKRACLLFVLSICVLI